MKNILMMVALLSVFPRCLDAQTAGYDGAADVAVDRLGNIHVTGSSADAGARIDIATVAYDVAGNELWRTRHDGGGDDGARAIAVSPVGAIGVAGWSRRDDGGTDAVVVGYISSLSVRRAGSNPGMLQWNLISSPSNRSIDARLTVATRGHVRLGLYDMLGRRIASLVDADLEPGSYSISLASALPAGCYVARLTTGGNRTEESAMTSMVLVR
jgi:hypothetical protein